MIRITKAELTSKIVSLMDLGLKNNEIAVRLNEEYNADVSNKLSTASVAALKKQLGLKGMKPKKRALFELIEYNEEIQLEDLAVEAVEEAAPEPEEEVPSEIDPSDAEDAMQERAIQTLVQKLEESNEPVAATQYIQDTDF